MTTTLDAAGRIVVPVVLPATRSGVREILTADRRDFAVYRVSGRPRFIDVLASE